MSKKLLFVSTVIAVSIPTAAFAQKAEKKGETVQVTTPPTNTSKGSENPPITDVGDLSTRARRDYVADPTGISLGGMLGNGFGDAYGVGLGLKGGYTLPNRIYVGGLLNYHFGSSTEFLGTNINQKTWYVGPEAGYDLGLGKVILRPVLGLGLGFRSGAVTGANVATAPGENTETDVRPYLAPGASIHYPIGNFFIGGDSRFMIMRDNTALTLFGTGGVHL